jgi:hypothetical protein
MKNVIPINGVPNQSFSFSANKYEIFVTLYSVYGLICADVSIGNKIVCKGVKCIANTSFIPHSAEKEINGKLYFETPKSYPTFEDMETDDCKLIFESNDESN